ncbi:hypothetical protein [Bacillus cereus]|nr:hypothetical protein [Bacillus cereus]
MDQSHQSFIVRLDTRNDYQTQLVFNMGHVHFFDAEAQLRIK